METTYIIIGALIIYGSITTYGVINLMRKNELQEDEIDESLKLLDNYETWFESFKQKLNTSYKKIKDIDRLGSFEADDETGFVFKEIFGIMDDIDNHISVDSQPEETKEKTEKYD